MSEPRTRARAIRRLAPGLLHWTIRDERIRFRSDAYAVGGRDGRVLIDPLPLTGKALSRLGVVAAICLTGSCHQRSAWRYRRRFGAPVYAPRGSRGLDERPDRLYGRGARLPGGLVAIHAPGPTRVHFALHLARGRGALFCADVLMRRGKGLGFVPDEHQDDPPRTRRTAAAFLKRRFAALCCAHGAPIVGGARMAIRRALAADGEK